jgi:hypothetical protein
MSVRSGYVLLTAIALMSGGALAGSFPTTSPASENFQASPTMTFDRALKGDRQGATSTSAKPQMPVGCEPSVSGIRTTEVSQTAARCLT